MPKQSKGGSDGGMMSLSECAAHLHLGEKTVLKLANEGRLPGVQVGKQWRFERAELEKWLAERLDLTDAEELEEIPDGTRVPLGDLLPEAAVIGDLESQDALGVIEELAARAYNQKWLNDKPWFVGALIERETLASTAMEGGVAFLHTRAREASRIARPFVIVGRSYNGVDFGAPDGKPTFLFFLLGLKYDKLHLPILGRIARSIRRPATIAKLRSQPSAAKMRALLLEEDARARSKAQQSPVPYQEFKPKLDRLMRLRTIKRLDALRKREAKQADKVQKKKPKTRAGERTAAPSEARAATGKRATAAAAARKAAPVKKAAPGRKAPAKSAPAENLPAKKAPAKKAPAKKAPARKAPAKKAPAKKAPAKKAPAKKAPVKKAPAKKAPVKKAPAKKAPVKKAPAKKAPAKKAPARKAPAKKAPAKKAPAKKAPARKTPAKKAPARRATADKSSSRAPGKPAARKATARKTPGKRATGKKTTGRK